MGEAAVNVARACNYTGAGTVEFLMDENHRFYFLEMNTRLQVEHPVTEMITGLDLVREQIRVARGEQLGYTQTDLKINGHAIELRVCAEDPFENFVPSTGVLTTYNKPEGKGIRVDDCMEVNMEIPVYYDNMIAKLIVWAPDRMEAISLMKQAINDYEVEGIKTTLPFGEFVMNHPAFISGNFDTHFVKNHFDNPVADSDKDELIALFSAWYLDQERNKVVLPAMGSKKAWYMRRKSQV
jgi:acetyl/propionyl-CoA carboxylase alpha subunit